MTLTAVVVAGLAVALAVRVAVRWRQARALDRVSDRWLDQHHSGRP